MTISVGLIMGERPVLGAWSNEMFVIRGGRPIRGQVNVSGAKNAILPILAAALLCDGRTVLDNVSPLEDVNAMCHMVSAVGGRIEQVDNRLVVTVDRGLSPEVPNDLASMMRASLLLLGPLLVRLGRAKVALPGGCAIGSRPIDLHLKGFQSLGAEVKCESGWVEVSARKLEGSRVYLDFPSVTATENIMMTAALAPGVTTIENAAEEPEVVDVARYLQAAGARIFGAGTNTIRVEGVDTLHGVNHTVIPDRIEAGTLMLAAAITRGELRLTNVVIEHLKPVAGKLREAGVVVIEGEQSITVIADQRPKPVDLKTLPHPGFPTDMQAPFTALLAIADGTSIVTENIFENRFMHIDEIKRMGADIRVEGRTAVIQGVPSLMGTRVRATDLRAGAALVIAGLAAADCTEIMDVAHIDRGYYKLDERLNALGADIQRATL